MPNLKALCNNNELRLGPEVRGRVCLFARVSCCVYIRVKFMRALKKSSRRKQRRDRKLNYSVFKNELFSGGQLVVIILSRVAGDRYLLSVNEHGIIRVWKGTRGNL